MGNISSLTTRYSEEWNLHVIRIVDIIASCKNLIEHLLRDPCILCLKFPIFLLNAVAVRTWNSKVYGSVSSYFAVPLASDRATQPITYGFFSEFDSLKCEHVTYRLCVSTPAN